MSPTDFPDEAYFKGKPLYSFGYGLSYTTFRYANLRVGLDVSVDVTNSGMRDGDEVVQLYVRFPKSKVERPLKQLCGFERVSIPRGQTRTVHIPLKASSLAYWDETRNAWSTEKGTVEI